MSGSYSVYSCSQARAGGQEDSSGLPVWVPAQGPQDGKDLSASGSVGLGGGDPSPHAASLRAILKRPQQ